MDHNTGRPQKSLLVTLVNMETSLCTDIVSYSKVLKVRDEGAWMSGDWLNSTKSWRLEKLSGLSQGIKGKLSKVDCGDGYSHNVRQLTAGLN